MTVQDAYTRLDAARRLHLLGDWDHAAALLAGDTTPESLALTAEIHYEKLLFQLDGIDAAADATAALDPQSPDALLLTARLAYARLVFQLDPRPDDYETAATGYRLASAHPTTHGWSEFHWGALLDNVADDSAAARDHYAEAMRAANDEHDLLLDAMVLRHLAGHVADDGDHAEALRMLRRSLALRAAAGKRPQVAAAQLLLAGELAADDPERASLVEAARSVADELNLSWVRSGLQQLTG